MGGGGGHTVKHDRAVIVTGALGFPSEVPAAKIKRVVGQVTYNSLFNERKQFSRRSFISWH